MTLEIWVAFCAGVMVGLLISLIFLLPKLIRKTEKLEPIAPPLLPTPRNPPVLQRVPKMTFEDVDF